MSDKLPLLLDKLYQLCLTGGYGLASAYTLAEQHKTRFPFHSDSLDKLIKQEADKATMAGFITGLGGILSLTITLPANTLSVLFIQMRLSTTIAILQGHDVRDTRIKILIYLSLCLISSKLKLQQFCLATLMKQPNEIFQQISFSITKQLIVILSTKQSVKLIKAIPAIGGVMGAVIDRIITYRIGKFSKSQFGQFY
ncbi:EcsC family protein [uncultured Gilliamella sp.]|uniref:EcsC family protein n=1 Tax=uncultured Gilliamella sp. TaxID=1193505 RepID=UPI0025F0B77B|nr:EcsC family protein [uncultured Gilliamella sp.]